VVLVIHQALVHLKEITAVLFREAAILAQAEAAAQVQLALMVAVALALKLVEMAARAQPQA
jgi:hypothetical protein